MGCIERRRPRKGHRGRLTPVVCELREVFGLNDAEAGAAAAAMWILRARRDGDLDAMATT